jgi:hypothetical protein
VHPRFGLTPAVASRNRALSEKMLTPRLRQYPRGTSCGPSDRAGGCAVAVVDANLIGSIAMLVIVRLGSKAQGGAEIGRFLGYSCRGMADPFEVMAHENAKIGQIGSSFVSFEQLPAKFQLQLLYCARQRRLRNPTSRGCACETMLLAKREEIKNLVHFHRRISELSSRDKHRVLQEGRGNRSCDCQHVENEPDRCDGTFRPTSVRIRLSLSYSHGPPPCEPLTCVRDGDSEPVHIHACRLWEAPTLGNA